MHSGHSLLFRFGTLQLCPLPQNINQVEESLSGCSGKDVHGVRTEHNLKNSSTTEGGAEVLTNVTLRWCMGTRWSGKVLFCYWLFFVITSIHTFFKLCFSKENKNFYSGCFLDLCYIDFFQMISANIGKLEIKQCRILDDEWHFLRVSADTCQTQQDVWWCEGYKVRNNRRFSEVSTCISLILSLPSSFFLLH